MNILRLSVISLSLLSVTATALVAQDQVVTLHRGRAFTEAEAVQNLATFAATYDDQQSWQARAANIRAAIARGMKLDRLPTACDLKPIRHSLRKMDGYTVENVAFESLPGYWVTGNLYLPAKISGKIPGVLSPHGHGANVRLGAPVQTRCAAFARMGAAVFAWDMVGIGESQPCRHKRSQVMRLQTYNSMRVIDFLLSLSFVDEDRLAVTGASGGGTQSFLLAALDDRIDVSVPVVQVSAHFYGGCECESGMPIHKSATHQTNNVEIAAMFAPKPQLIVSDGGDWTVNTPRVEYPYVRNVYQLFGAEDQVANAHFADEGHNYGPSKRTAAYRFLAQHLGLDLAAVQNDSGEIDESFITVQSLDDLKVFDPEHPRPEYAVTSCEAVLELLDR